MPKFSFFSKIILSAAVALSIGQLSFLRPAIAQAAVIPPATQLANLLVTLNTATTTANVLIQSASTTPTALNIPAAQAARTTLKTTYDAATILSQVVLQDAQQAVTNAKAVVKTATDVIFNADGTLKALQKGPKMRAYINLAIAQIQLARAQLAVAKAQVDILVIAQAGLTLAQLDRAIALAQNNTAAIVAANLAVDAAVKNVQNALQTVQSAPNDAKVTAQAAQVTAARVQITADIAAAEAQAVMDAVNATLATTGGVPQSLIQIASAINTGLNTINAPGTNNGLAMASDDYQYWAHLNDPFAYTPTTLVAKAQGILDARKVLQGTMTLAPVLNSVTFVATTSAFPQSQDAILVLNNTNPPATAPGLAAAALDALNASIAQTNTQQSQVAAAQQQLQDEAKLAAAAQATAAGQAAQAATLQAQQAAAQAAQAAAGQYNTVTGGGVTQAANAGAPAPSAFGGQSAGAFLSAAVTPCAAMALASVAGAWAIGAITSALSWGASIFMVPTANPTSALPQGISGATQQFKTFEDCLIYQMGQLMLENLTNSTVAWIQGGFNGKPSFATDLNVLLAGSEDIAGGDVVRQLRGIRVCDFTPSFKNDLAGSMELATAKKYRNMFTDKVSCPFGNGPLLKYTASMFYRDFGNGGWRALEASLSDNGNPFGVVIAANKQLDTQKSSQAEMAKEQRSWSGGFANLVDPNNCNYPRTVALYIQGKVENIDNGVLNVQTITPDPGMVHSYQKQYCKTTTPGKIIQDQLTKTLGTDMERIGAADSVNKIVQALISFVMTKTTQAVFP